MSSELARTYNNELYKAKGYYSAWAPIIRSPKLGDYGQFNDGVFDNKGDISTLTKGLSNPIIVEEGEPDNTPTDAIVTYGSFSKDKFMINAEYQKVEVDAIGDDDDIQFGITYSAEKNISFEFDAPGVYSITMANTDEEIWSALSKVKDHAGDDWNTSNKIVYKVYYASSYFLIASQSKGSAFDLTGFGNVVSKFDTGGMSSTSGGLSLEITKEVNETIVLLAYEPAIIGFELMRFKNSGKVEKPWKK